MSKLYYSRVIVDGRCLDLLLDEDEIATGIERALENPTIVDQFPEASGSCWPMEKPPKCNFWNRITNKCCECNRKAES